MARKLSMTVRNMNRRNRRLSEPDIPRSLLGRDLTGFRFEYWYAVIDYDGSRSYFRSRRLAYREQGAREPSRGADGVLLERVRALTSDGRRGWLLDDGGLTTARIAMSLAARREARRARRVRAKAAAAATAV